MIDSGNYSDRDTPPKHPAFDGTEPKRPKKTSLSEAIVEAANCLSKHMHTTDIRQSGGSNAVNFSNTRNARESGSSSEFPASVGISPGRITELRIKKLQELRELQLLEQNVLTEEFTEQKSMVLNSLRKLSH